MQIIKLYRYVRPDGGVTISPNKPDVEYTEMVRLVADDGKILTNGSEETSCLDIVNPDGWQEIDYVEPVEEDEN